MSKGRVSVITVAATAGNLANNIANLTGYRRRILGWMITLVCSADVANRTVRVRRVVTGSSNLVGPALQSNTITASQTKTFGATSGVQSGTYGSAFRSDDSGFYLTEDMFTEAGITLSFDVTNGVAADSYSGYVLVEDIPA